MFQLSYLAMKEKCELDRLWNLEENQVSVTLTLQKDDVGFWKMMMWEIDWNNQEEGPSGQVGAVALTQTKEDGSQDLGDGLEVDGGSQRVSQRDN